ncbi:MAG: serine hydrolase [Candidatus Pacebacteria bacterium]|nr:serine hydrolase [Candidatus Paceibacterota bacterium]
MKTKVFLASFILSLPLWWGVNAFSLSFENFIFWYELSKTPGVFTANIGQAYDIDISRDKLNRSINGLFEEIEVKSEAALVLEVMPGNVERVIYEKNIDKPLAIASLSKLMTALVVFDLKETYGFSEPVLITEEAVNQDGSSKYGELAEGEYLRVKDLVYIMLIESSNDAAFALSELVSDKELENKDEPFVGLMNIYAKNIGLYSTKFINSTGLDSGSGANLSTALDVARLTKYIYIKYPKIFEITSQNSYEVAKADGSLHHFIPENTNKLLTEIKGVIGGKTGWTPLAKGCLLIILKNPSSSSYFINVVLGADDRFSEMKKLIELTSRI